MTGPGAYEDEMMVRPLRDVSDEELDRLLDGGEPRPELADVAAFVRGLPAALAEAPGEAIARRHLAAIVDAAARTPTPDPAGEAPAERGRPRSARRWIPVSRSRSLRVLVAGLAGAVVLSLLTTGLAVAGVVELPEAARQALEAAGITLPARGAQVDDVPSPDQLPEEADETAVAVLGAIAQNLPGLRDGSISGCEFGAAVAAAAGGGDGDTSHCPDGEGTGAAQAGSAGAADDGVPGGGRSVAEQARTAAQEGRARGEEASAAGRRVAEEASGAPADVPGAPADVPGAPAQ